nr:RNA repair transcriptional activator RtcR [Kofleriaceae bacterium]
MSKATVVIGLLGATLDVGRGPKRWERWRPTVSVCQQADWHVDRFDLIVNPSHTTQASIAETIAADIRVVSPDTKVVRHAVPMVNAWDFSEVFAALSEFADNYTFDLAANDYYVHITTGTHVAQICLFLLCETRMIPARLLQTSPVHVDGGRTPEGGNSVIDLDLAKYDRLAARFAKRITTSREQLKAGIATRNAAFNQLIDELEQVATRSKDPILLGGATGTGKSALAERIHALKKRQHQLTGDFVAVNCATLRGDGAMSALFGHARGAFTGATEARPGLLRKANGGLLFLDEIGELGLDEQAMLLTALEEKRFYPLGADKHVSSDFQLIVGSNRDLAREVRTGRFREDLLARIAVWSFHLPALAARREDIEPNLDFELARVGAAIGVGVTMSRPARQAFIAFATGAEGLWPANFRDFGAAVRRMATLAHGGRIDEGDVARELTRLRQAWRHAPTLNSLATRTSLAGAAQPGAVEPGSAAMAMNPQVDAMLTTRFAQLDRFDYVQLADVLRVCAAAPSLSAAGRVLFAHTLSQRKT